LKSFVALQEVYVGKEEGLRIAKEYCYFLAEQGQYQCKLCPFTSRGQCVETHVLAKHLTKLYLFRSAKSNRHICSSSRPNLGCRQIKLKKLMTFATDNIRYGP
jgi:hypothetical protein